MRDSIELIEYCRFVRTYLASQPGDIIEVPAHVTRRELEGVVRGRQLLEEEHRQTAYAAWRAN